jgi:hypothetical protein
VTAVETRRGADARRGGAEPAGRTTRSGGASPRAGRRGKVLPTVVLLIGTRQ